MVTLQKTGNRVAHILAASAATTGAATNFVQRGSERRIRARRARRRLLRQGRPELRRVGGRAASEGRPTARRIRGTSARRNGARRRHGDGPHCPPGGGARRPKWGRL